MSKTLNLIVQYNVLPLVIALFGGGIILIIAFSYHPGQAITKQYERIRGELQEKKKIGIFDYDQIQKKLISNGFAFRHPGLADPLVYTGVKFCMGAAAAALTAQFHPAVAFLGFVLGYALLDLLHFPEEPALHGILILRKNYPALKLSILFPATETMTFLIFFRMSEVTTCTGSILDKECAYG